MNMSFKACKVGIWSPKNIYYNMNFHYFKINKKYLDFWKKILDL